jgi:serine protease Do
MATPKKNLYEILGISPDANSLDIGLAYQRRTAELQRAVPPDPGAQSFLHEAHEILANPKRRAAYDASLVTAAEKAAAAEQETDLVLEGDEEEPEPNRKYLGPGIAVATVVALAIYFAVRSGHTPEAPKPVEPVAVAPAPPPPPPQPLRAEQILPAALASLGRVMSYEMSGRAMPIGMALAVEPDTMITTCHAIPGGSQLVVRVGADSDSASLIVTDEVLDLCKVAVAGLNTRPLPIAPDDAKAGDKVYVLGANAKGDLALTEATVKALHTTPQGKVLELSVPVAPGASGGAVFDAFGRLAGITTTPHAYGPGLQIALPAAWIAEMRTRNAVK